MHTNELNETKNTEINNKAVNDTINYIKDIVDSLNTIIFIKDNPLSVNLQDNNGDTVLYKICKCSSDLKIIKYLVEQGADVNLQNNKGYTALHNACKRKNNLEVVKYLVEHGANVNVQPANKGHTALHYAYMFNGYDETLTFLLDNGANPTIQSDSFVFGLLPGNKYYNRYYNHNAINITDEINDNKKRKIC